MSENIRIYNSGDLAFENLSKDHLVLVDFWATWCGPCRMMAPILEEAAAEVKDVVFAKVDVDQNPDAAMDLRIQAVPTLMLFRDGEPVDRMIGVLDKKSLIEEIDKFR